MLNVVVVVSPRSSSRGSTRLRLTTFCHRALVLWLVLAACTHSNTCLFLGVNNDAVVK
jgi:hypothetical protein